MRSKPWNYQAPQDLCSNMWAYLKQHEQSSGFSGYGRVDRWISHRASASCDRSGRAINGVAIPAAPGFGCCVWRTPCAALAEGWADQQPLQCPKEPGARAFAVGRLCVSGFTLDRSLFLVASCGCRGSDRE